MSIRAPLSMWMRVRRMGDSAAVYLPMVFMGVMAMGTYWLVQNTPATNVTEEEAAAKHEPDYYLRNFSVRVFGVDGKLKSETHGVEGRHFPDTDTLEIEQPRIRFLNADGRVTTAVGARGLVNSDGSEAQLYDKAVVVREAGVNSQGVSVPRSELQSDFLHVFANTEQVRSHLPVVMVRGEGDRFYGDAMEYDNLGRGVQLNGRVRGTIQPRKDRDQK